MSYRKKILVGNLKNLDQGITNITKLGDFRNASDARNIHLFVACDTWISPTKIVKTFKGITANKAFKKFPKLRQKMWKGKLWSPSHYVGTAGPVSAQTSDRYICEQEK